MASSTMASRALVIFSVIYLNICTSLGAQSCQFVQMTTQQKGRGEYHIKLRFPTLAECFQATRDQGKTAVNWVLAEGDEKCFILKNPSTGFKPNVLATYYEEVCTTTNDVNECALNTDNCATHATCTNTVGSFTCACNAGYTGNGVTCTITDVNECAQNTDNCATHATCTNTVGSFTCACNAGYTGNGVTCTITGGSSGFSQNYDYFDALKKSNLFYEAQRSGDLPSSNRIPWRGDSALQDGNLAGGWYDAGDHMKFNFPMASATTVLAWGMLEFPGGYGNQLAVARDSIKWSLDYLLKCHTSTNVLYGQVGNPSLDHGWWGRPEDMTMSRPQYKIDAAHPGSDLAAETAAAMAAGYLVFQSSAGAYANTLKNHAVQLYNFAKTSLGKYSNAIPTVQGLYTSSGYWDELCWAALWLHKATGNNAYKTDAINFFNAHLNNKAWAFSWDDKKVGAQIMLYQLTGGNQYKNQVVAFLNDYKNTLPRTPKGLVHRNPWGVLRYAANAAFIALMADKSGIEIAGMRDWAQSQIDYMLGDGGRSYMVGFGNNPPTQCHHRGASCRSPPNVCNWNDLNKTGPNPHVLYGALVGGPDLGDNYTDDRNDYQQNEVACDYNAGLQGALAALRSTW